MLRITAFTPSVLARISVTSRPVDGRLVKNLILVKEACANANAETGRLAADKHRMIVDACEAILDDFDRFASDLRTPAIQGEPGRAPT